MRFYMVSPTVDVDHDETKPEVRWAGTQADARAAKQQMMEDFGLKRSQVDVDEEDVPTDKAGLLAFLNDRVRTLKD
jgi:hypothetical protein